MEEYKFDLAKKLISIATKCNGYVYGEFVRDVIIPKLNNSECDISFNNIDIWFKRLNDRLHFVNRLWYFFQEDKNLTHDFVISEDQLKYKISKHPNCETLFCINAISSDQFPKQSFDVNCLKYQYYDEFVMCGYAFSYDVNSNSLIFKQNINKRTVMDSDYNPKTEEEFNQIDKDYFQKGWSIITDKQTELSKWIIKNNITVTIGIEDGLWVYRPNDVKIYIPSLRIAGTEQDIRKAIKSIYPDYSEEHINDLIKNTDNIVKSKWYRGMIEQNTKNDYFIDVGKRQVSYRILSGAARLWTSPDLKKNDIVYILPLRICGTHNDIRETLKSAEPPYTENEIDNYLGDAISKYNYQTTKVNEYNQEIANFRSKRKNNKWSRDLIMSFSKYKSFARVGRENITRIHLSAASHFWIYNPELNMIVFILPLRICGTPDDIRKTLRSVEPPYSEEEINNYLKDAITKDNYQTTKADDYNKEIDNLLPEMYKLAEKITNDFMNNNIISPNNANFNTILNDLIKDISDKPKEDKSKEDKSKEDKSKEDKSKEDKSKEDKSKEDKSKEDKSKEDKSKEDKSQSNLPRVGFMTEEADEIPVLKENIMRIVGGDSFYPRNLDDKSKGNQLKDITGGDVLYLRKEDESKAVMRSIFSTGLESLSKKFNNDTENKELQYIYKCGLDQYNDKFNNLIKDM
jgi:hypothetical protein